MKGFLFRKYKSFIQITYTTALLLFLKLSDFSKIPDRLQTGLFDGILKIANLKI